ncbi:MAG: histidinol-phosphate transaminase [Phycisphaerae bacterium]|nr:histidinol-phosphate transaminase [Phycisphaerae bacterium]
MRNENTTPNPASLPAGTATPADARPKRSSVTYFRDDVERTNGYVPGFQPKQTDAVKLNANENPYPPSPAVMKALAELTAEHLRRYPESRGDSFREAAAEVNGVEPDNIICGKGGDDLLSIALGAFCDESRPVAYPVPTYSLYRVLADLEGCEALEIPFEEESHLPAGLAKAGAALTMVCNPNAPSGTWIPIEDLAELAGKVTGVLLIDEAYVDFAPQNAGHLVKEFDNVMVLRSLSKGYSLAGLRFGYAIAQKNVIAGLMKVKDSYNVDAIAIALATAAIKDQAYFRENVGKIKRQRQSLTEQLRALGFDVSDSHTNFVQARPRTGSAAAIHKQLVERNIYVRHYDVPDLKDKLRISIGSEEQNDRLIVALREILTS